MTIQELVTTCQRAGIVLAPAGDVLDVDAPAHALTATLRDELKAHKSDLLAVLTRLDGMRRTLGKVPVPLRPFGAVRRARPVFQLRRGIAASGRLRTLWTV